jgi:predicted lipid-binding transport protein (Tim44 family)
MTGMMNLSSRRGRAAIALAAALTLAGSVAEARVGRGGSFGSRGGRTFDAPPATRTAPTPASPIERSQIPQNQFQNRPGVPPGGTFAQPRRFGFGTGLFAGLLGAGLLGMLFGNGFFGGLAGLASFFGLLIQVGLLALLAVWVVRWFRRREQPAAAQAYGRASTGPGPMPPMGGAGRPAGGALGAMLGSRPAATRAARPGVRDEVAIGEADYTAFERTLHEVQAAYSRGDVAALWSLATPEMAGYIQEELNENAAQGVVNTVANVRLLQGDLAEAWREGETEYATVAMRFAHTDVTTEKATGRVVSGDPTKVVEATELWTFRRDRGGAWTLSAIQQG